MRQAQFLYSSEVKVSNRYKRKHDEVLTYDGSLTSTVVVAAVVSVSFEISDLLSSTFSASAAAYARSNKD